MFIILKYQFIPGVTEESKLSEEALRTFLDDRADESRQTMSLSALDELVADKLRMNMKDRSAKSRMECLFIDYGVLSHNQGLSWVTDDNPKTAAYHIVAVKPTSLRQRLEDDLDFSHTDLKKKFQEFMKHAVKVAEALQICDNRCKDSSSTSQTKHREKGGKKKI